MIVVLDTNIFISGIFWNGDSDKILTFWKEDKIKIINSDETVDELIRVLSKFKIQLSDELKKEWIKLIISNSTLVKPIENFTIIKEDPTDNKFIDVAVEGNADCIITNDKHLLKIKQFKNIKIITPKEFLKII
jgi:uncharacterized protein